MILVKDYKKMIKLLFKNMIKIMQHLLFYINNN